MRKVRAGSQSKRVVRGRNTARFNEVNLDGLAGAHAERLGALHGLLSDLPGVPDHVREDRRAEFVAIADELHDATDREDAVAVTRGEARMAVLEASVALSAAPNAGAADALTDAQLRLGEVSLGDVLGALRGPDEGVPDQERGPIVDRLVADSRSDDALLRLEARAQLIALGALEAGTLGAAVAQAVAARLAAANQQTWKQLPQAQPSAEAPRTPLEVITHLLARAPALAANGDPVIGALVAEAKGHVLRRELSVEQTRAFLGQIREPKAARALAEALLEQLPATTAAMPPTRLQDNLYGRVFDSALISELVRQPPAGVISAMSRVLSGTHAWIHGEYAPGDAHISAPQLEQAIQGLQEKLRDDPRFWFVQVPALQAIAAASNDAPGPGQPSPAVQALDHYLTQPVQSGEEAVAVSYVMVRLWNTLKEAGAFIPWKDVADVNFNERITPQNGRIQGPSVSLPGLGDLSLKMLTPQTSGSGITLRHQPNPSVRDDQPASTRPTTVNMPDLAPHGTDAGPQRPFGAFPTESARTALQHGLPFASGVSGSTNLLLHLFEYLRTGGAKEVVANENKGFREPALNPRDGLLGAMMFLVHDGGHSIQEVLWTANQQDEALQLGLQVGDPARPNEFVANYETLAGLYAGATRQAIEDGTARAFDAITAYFEQYSAYEKAM